MRRIFKISVITAVVVIAAYVSYYVALDLIYMHHVRFLDHVPCAWIFADSAKKDINTFDVTASLRKTDKLYTCIYKGHYSVEIWEIETLKNVILQDVAFNKGVPLSNVHLYPGEILNSGSDLETNVKFGPFFDNQLVVDIGESSQVLSTFDEANYRGFYGVMSRMGFENGKGQIVVLENYAQGPKPTLFVLYKTHDSFYIIIVVSDAPFSERLLRIFDLR